MERAADVYRGGISRSEPPEVVSTTYISILIFLAVSFLFAVIFGFLLKFTAGRYIPLLLSIPLWLWIVIIILAMFALQGMGLPVNAWYSGFFNWLSSQLEG